MNGDGLRDEIAAALHHQNVWYIASDDMAVDLADAVLPVVQAHIDAAREQDLAALEAQISEHVAVQVRLAREQVAEQIARTLIDYAAKAASNRIGVDSQTREQFLNGKVTAFQIAADVARQHAKGEQ